MPNSETETNLSEPQPITPPGQSATLVTSHKQVAEALVKYHNLQEGIWGLYIRFGLAASNVGPDDQQLSPAAIIPVVELGLQRFAKETNLSVDAAKVNPRPEPAVGSRHRRSHR